MEMADSFPGDKGLAALSQLLATAPPAGSVLKLLATNHLHMWQVRAAWLAELEDSGTFRLDASFGGVDAQEFEARRPTTWGANSMATAISLGKGTVLTVSDDRLEDSRFLHDSVKVLAVIPIQPTFDAQFVLGLGCATSQENVEALLAEIYHYVPLIALYLTYMRERRNASVFDGQHSTNDLALTARQMTILRLMDDRLKNREISLAIGYSESTVRLEAMEIYRKLGVRGRREAVRVAAQLGMFDQVVEV